MPIYLHQAYIADIMSIFTVAAGRNTYSDGSLSISFRLEQLWISPNYTHLENIEVLLKPHLIFVISELSPTRSWYR